MGLSACERCCIHAQNVLVQDEAAEAEGTALAEDVSNLGILSTDGTTLSSAEDTQDNPPALAPGNLSASLTLCMNT